MRVDRQNGKLALILPAVAGLGLLAVGLMLLPSQREILPAERRAQPLSGVSSTLPSATPAPAPASAPPHPVIAAEISTATAARLAALTAQLIADGVPVTTAQIAYDLVAAGRPAVALAYLAARPDGSAVATWRLRVDLLNRTGREPAAAALVAAAARMRGAVPPADLVAAAYAIDRPDLVVLASANGVIPPPDTRLALDLARRAEAADRGDLIALLDRATRADWRAADPWLAIRLAARDRDVAAGLRAANGLPVDQRAAAREAILTESGDREGLRAELVAHAAIPGARPDTSAERLLAAGYRDDAIALLRTAASGQPSTAAVSRRLLYLMGPRPGADDVAWLRQQAMQGDTQQQRGWLSSYVERDRPADALAFVSRHPLAAQTDVMLMRLSLARAAHDDSEGRAALAALLDGRPLDPAQLAALSATAPARLGPAQAAEIARRRIAAGVAGPRDQLDLAWTAWNAGDAKAAAKWLDGQLASTPTDLPTLRLMADVQSRIGGDRAARPWLERALAQTPDESRARAELLNTLGRRAEAVALVETLRADTPDDPALAALHARLLIARGQPGRARALLAQ